MYMYLVIATIVMDIKKLKDDFDEHRFSFARRENNYVSHKLAKFAMNLKGCLLNRSVTPQSGCLKVLTQILGEQ